MRALIIDDSRAIRAIISRTLKELGVGECVEAGDGKAGLAAIAVKGPFNFAMVDWNMPEMNGYEFIRSVRASADWRDLPMMMVTTETEMEQVVRALAAGANEYLMKPFTPEMVEEKLQILGIKGS